MQHTTPSVVWTAALIVLVAGTVSGGDLWPPMAPPSSAEALAAAAAALQAEQEATKGFGGSSPLVVPAAAFATNGNYDGTYFFHPFEGHMRGTAATDGCVQAPVYLPRGAEVFQIYASILDEDAGADVYLSLMRSDNFAYHDADTMAAAHSNGSSSVIQSIFDETVQYAGIEHPRYHYWVALCLPSADTKLYSVRVYFNDTEIFSDSLESGDTGAWASP
jgi:hypothetical protein